MNELIISKEKVKYSLWINCFKTLHCSLVYSFIQVFIQQMLVIRNDQGTMQSTWIQRWIIHSPFLKRWQTHNPSALKQFCKCNDRNTWSITENMSIRKLSELNIYEHIIFKVALFVLNTKNTVNNSIYILEKCDLSTGVKAIVSTN